MSCGRRPAPPSHPPPSSPPPRYPITCTGPFPLGPRRYQNAPTSCLLDDFLFYASRPVWSDLAFPSAGSSLYHPFFPGWLRLTSGRSILGISLDGPPARRGFYLSPASATSLTSLLVALAAALRVHTRLRRHSLELSLESGASSNHARRLIFADPVALNGLCTRHGPTTLLRARAVAGPRLSMV